ncbi:hypothetical protein AGMMS50239_39770 [Bacteroidia bacterium]|nr:hypothetical protein AGMMS50239_39770 [Bacteroidia bacterium]
MQKDFDLYGQDSFECTVLCLCGNKLDMVMFEKLFIRREGELPLYNKACPINGNYGIKWSESSRKKFSSSKLGKKITHIDYDKNGKLSRKKVVSVDRDGDTKMYQSIQEASTLLRIDRTSISKALHGVCKSAGGFKWAFAEESALKNRVNSVNPEMGILSQVLKLRKGKGKVQRLICEQQSDNQNTKSRHREPMKI